MATKKTVDAGIVDCTEEMRLNETPKEKLDARLVRQQVGGE
jgi:hypothetical protein